VLGEKATRAALYVAMTRGRESNSAYMYQRAAEASEYTHAGPDGPHMLRRAPLFRQIIATVARAQTAHELAAETGRDRLPTRVPALLIDRRNHCGHARRATYRQRCSKAVKKQFAEVAVLLARAITASRYRRG